MRYLEELRLCLLRTAGIFIVCTIFAVFYSQTILDIVLSPISSEINGLVFTNLMAPIILQVKLSFLLSLLIIFPYLLIEVWWYVKTALYQNERKAIVPILVMGALLFYLGVLAGWKLLLPQMVMISKNWMPARIGVMIDVSGAIDLVLVVSLVSGLSFQVPLIMLLLGRLGVLKVAHVKGRRREVLVLSLILGMCLTPPDVFAQIIVAIPLYGLFELGILMMRSLECAQIQEKKSQAQLDDHRPDELQFFEGSYDRPHDENRSQ